MLGLIAYAMIRDMDATIASMLTGLFGVLFGRSTKLASKNGNGATEEGARRRHQGTKGHD